MVEPRQSQTVNAALGLVGPTGSGKTSLIATAAEYLWDTHQAVLHLATADGGGFPTKVQALVNQGVIRVWRMRTRGEAFETTVRASAGWWPSVINPRTGETPPNVKLVPPVTERYTMRCPQGHIVKTVPFQSLLTPVLCPTCKTHVTRETMTVERESHRTKGFERCGGVAFDGLTSFLSWQLQDMGQRHARMELKGEDTALGGRIVSGDLQLGGNNRSHFGFVQGQAEAMVLNSTGIPGLIIPPIWTMLLLETVDEGGLPVKGPKLAGKAKTDEAPAWFGNMLEVGVVKDEHGNDVRRLWLSEFVDDNGVRHLIKHRGGPAMPPYLEDTVGQPWSQVHLGVFFDLLDKDIQETNAAAGEKYKDAPGLSGEAMTFGEGEGITPAPAGGAPAAAAQAPVTQTARPTPARPGVRPPTARAPKPKPPTMPAAVDAGTASTTPVAPVAEGEPTPEPTPVAPETAVEAAVVEPITPPAPSTPAQPLAAPPAQARPAAAPVTRSAPGPRPVLAPPPGPRPPAVAPRRPAPRPATPPPVPVGS